MVWTSIVSWSLQVEKERWRLAQERMKVEMERQAMMEERKHVQVRQRGRMGLRGIFRTLEIWEFLELINIFTQVFVLINRPILENITINKKLRAMKLVFPIG